MPHIVFTCLHTWTKCTKICTSRNMYAFTVCPHRAVILEQTSLNPRVISHNHDIISRYHRPNVTSFPYFRSPLTYYMARQTETLPSILDKLLWEQSEDGTKQIDSVLDDPRQELAEARLNVVWQICKRKANVLVTNIGPSWIVI